MGRIGTIIKVASVAGPAIVKVVQKYGPQLRQLAKDNPEALGSIKRRVTAVAHATTRGNSLHAVGNRIGVLRDQVTYLFASANTPAVARQASAWRAELDALETLIPVVGAMSRPMQKSELKAIQKRIDALSASILAATIGDDIEDAETVVDYQGGADYQDGNGQQSFSEQTGRAERTDSGDNSGMSAHGADAPTGY